MLAPLAAGCRQPIAWGMNCGIGPDGLLGAVERAVRLTHAAADRAAQRRHAQGSREPPHLSLLAGVSGRATPSATWSWARRPWAAAAAPRPSTSARWPRPSSRWRGRRCSRVVAEPAAGVEPKPPAPLAEKSRLGRAAGRPPVGHHGRTAAAARLRPAVDDRQEPRRCAQRGVDAINIPDGPRASSRISPLVTAERILREARIEPILHFCCRDRNLIGMQADLLACAACGVRNILFVTGDPPKLGDYPHATGVFDADSIGMAAVQRRLNCGIDLGGQAIDPPTFAVIGVGLDPTALDQQRELDRFRQKVEAGAEFAITQPVFDPDALLRFLDEVAAATAFRSSPASGRWPAIATPRSCGTRCRAWSCPTRSWSGWPRSKAARGSWPWASRSPASRSPASAIAWPASRSVAPFGKIETAWAVIEE